MKNISQDPKKTLKQIFKNYRRMTAGIKRTLAELGISAEKGRKHWILKYNDRIFVCPTTSSDCRGGMNLALEISRALF